MKECGDSSTLAMELPQSCAKPSMYRCECHLVLKHIRKKFIIMILIMEYVVSCRSKVDYKRDLPNWSPFRNCLKPPSLDCKTPMKNYWPMKNATLTIRNWSLNLLLRWAYHCKLTSLVSYLLLDAWAKRRPCFSFWKHGLLYWNPATCVFLTNK